MYICEATCGLCNDWCVDDAQAQIFVDFDVVQSCEWLSMRPRWISRLCIPGKDAWEYCQDTCNSCPSPSSSPTKAPSVDLTAREFTRRPIGSSAPETKAPTKAPTPAPTIPCDDQHFITFEVDGYFLNKTCVWLAARVADQINTTCVNNAAAMNACPETCGKCADTCVDDTVTPWTDKDGHIRTCKWLRERPRNFHIYCREGFIANDLCKESCEAC